MNSESGSTARRREQKLAFFAIRALSFATLFVLALIVGFILYRGLRSTAETREIMLPIAEHSPNGLSVIVNIKNPATSIDWKTLNGIFSDEYINWSKIDGGSENLIPAIPSHLKQEISALVFGVDQPQWGGLTEILNDENETIHYTETHNGAIAIIRAASAEKAIAAGMQIKTLGVRRIGIAANPSVYELINNSEIRDLKEGELAKLLSGDIHNWHELDGPDIPICIIAPPQGTELSRVFATSGFKIHNTASRTAVLQTVPSDTVQPATMADYFEALCSTKGAAGPIFAEDIARIETESGDSAPAFLVRRVVTESWNLTPSYIFEQPKLSGRAGGISTIILNTVFMILLTLLIAAPLGMAAAVYLVEYARQGRLLRLLRLGTDTLAGIPSIIFGLFGMLFFVNTCHFGFGLLSGCLTLSLMILPTIISTSGEAIKAVPSSLREASLALGATKLSTIRRVVLPAAAPGIAAGLILAAGRALGETAALIFTMGSDYKLAGGLSGSARVLSTHIYLLFAEGISFDRAFSTAAVLLIIIMLFNTVTKLILRRLSKNAGGTI